MNRTEITAEEIEKFLIDDIENGDLGNVIFNAVTDSSLPYEDYELANLYLQATPEEMEAYDKILVNITGMTFRSIVTEALEKKKENIER